MITPPIQIIVGSMLGGTEYVAEAAESALNELGFETTLHLTPDLSQINMQQSSWLVCTSTHGAGEFPDNLKPFVAQLENCTAEKLPTNFMVIGVGDSSYDTFCQAARDMESLLISKGCKKLINNLYIDMQQPEDPEELAYDFIKRSLSQS